jgi:PAS domain S-box-containing protein
MSRISENIPVDDNSKPAYYNKICLRVVDNINAMVAYWDKDEICRFANNAYMEWFGRSRNELVGKVTMKELLGPIYEQNKPYIKGVLTGKTQVFERVLTLPDGTLRYYIATYNPDIIEGDIIGFYVHVADINLIKKLEAKLLNAEKTKRREVLRSVIETQETERELIAYELRDKVNQTLAYTKMMLRTVGKNKADSVLLELISHNIHETIDELNKISSNLTPSIITMIGFIPGIKEYIDNLIKRNGVKIDFECLDKKIENLEVNDKISIFRIIQNYLLILAANPACNIISIEISRSNSKLILKMSHNNPEFQLPVKSREFIDIAHRLEYYDGSQREFQEENKKFLLMEIKVPT